MNRATAKSIKAEFTVTQPAKGSGGAAVLNLSGYWIVTRLEGIAARMRESLDCAGAFALHYALEDMLEG